MSNKAVYALLPGTLVPCASPPMAVQAVLPELWKETLMTCHFCNATYTGTTCPNSGKLLNTTLKKINA